MVGSGSGIKGEEEEVVSLLTQQLATERENNERMLDLTIFIPAGFFFFCFLRFFFFLFFFFFSSFSFCCSCNSLPLKIRVNEDAIVRDVFTEGLLFFLFFFFSLPLSLFSFPFLFLSFLFSLFSFLFSLLSSSAFFVLIFFS